MLSSEERSALVFTLAGVGGLLVALLFALGLFSDPAPPGAADPAAQAAARPALALGAVRGRLTDAHTGFGLASRTVEVRGLDAISDHWLVPPDPLAPGAFELRGLPAGRRCGVLLSADGYVDALREVAVASGVTTELGDVALVPLATVGGRVVDASGQGLGPAQVELESQDGSRRRCEVDAHGSFRFERLPPGEYRLTAAASSGEFSFVPTRVDASRGGEQGAARVEIFPGVSARGFLRLPVGSAPLHAVSAQGRRGEVSGDGRFEVTGLRAGPVRLLAHVDPLRAVAVAIEAPFDGEIALDPALARPLAELAAGPDEGLERLRGDDRADATEAPVLVVRAVDEAGLRLAGARVELSSAAAGARSWLRFTGRGGECTLRGLAVDTPWTVEARFGELRARATHLAVPGTTTAIVLTLARPAATEPPAAPADRAASDR